MLQRTLPAGFIAPCLPTKTDKLPSGSDWLHEIKHDGFRVIARKGGARGVRPTAQDEEPGLCGGDARSGGGLGKMTRRKREIAGLANEQDFPHLVELAVPPGGFRSVFLEFDAFHRERRIPVRRGRSRHEADAQGEIIGASKVARDITERKRLLEHQRFLIRELEHRAKNLFAIIQSIINRTLVEGQTIGGAKEVLTGRLNALAQAHSLLADAGWQGASLTDIIQRQFAGFSRRVNISGCDIVLNTPAAQQFALAVHELATNAVKYGALSVAEGNVSIECEVKRASENGTFSFLWKESGGPTVSAPRRKGFGSAILLDAAKQFGQHVALNYDPDGLRYELRLSLGAIEAANSAL
jgi:two-component sensor histidine kinase